MKINTIDYKNTDCKNYNIIADIRCSSIGEVLEIVDILMERERSNKPICPECFSALDEKNKCISNCTKRGV